MLGPEFRKIRAIFPWVRHLVITIFHLNMPCQKVTLLHLHWMRKPESTSSRFTSVIKPRTSWRGPGAASEFYFLVEYTEHIIDYHDNN